MPDTAYAYSAGDGTDENYITLQGDGWKGYQIKMTSQEWLPDLVTPSKWEHDLVVVIPDSLQAGTPEAGWATLINGGTVSGSTDNLKVIGDEVDAEDVDIQAAIGLAKKTGAIAAVLLQTPNQPLVFNDDVLTIPRFEDAIRAYTWTAYDESIKKGNEERPELLLELPMAKAAVRAMDTIQDFIQKKASDVPAVSSFAVTGCGKRSWSGILASATDKRIKAIPLCAHMMNVDEWGHDVIKRLNGADVFLSDYVGKSGAGDPSTGGWFGNLNRDNIKKQMAIMDSLGYIGKTEAKMMMFSSTGDDMFPLGQTKNFMEKFKGAGGRFFEHANSDHQTSITEDAYLSPMASWLTGVMHDNEPQIDWSIDKETGAIKAQQVSKHTPVAVHLWQASTCNNKRRDFRLTNAYQKTECDECGLSLPTGRCLNTKVGWTKTPISANSDGTWEASVPAPKDGKWIGFYLSFEYEPAKPGGDKIQLTTQPSILPDAYPFKACPDGECSGPFSTV
eukprot:gnl/TRDRNA2_/TRDRNA2_171360_c1_seq1.p1 gnl/TRDRNA2_/TRDRNA2_171360_c1~~gnl/TRDRNA2_/TRDRNA2_171360_c1_seq1.p1  ORF type:complete len:566 (+),score=111.39 gnl/TRDRNA2_/TRDRNA2_171360_c1_seq1:189-1700(+)